MEHWTAYSSVSSVEDKSITVTIPGVWKPFHYKIHPNGSDEDIDVEEEYFNDSNPWKGWVIDYVEEILKISNIAEFKYTHRSGGSSVAVNHSSDWSASVYDVNAGISCLSVSAFWVTMERLQMTAFSTPLTTDNFVLWIKNPYIGLKESNGFKSFFRLHNINKIFLPFHQLLWWTLLGTLIFASILGVWFTNENDHWRRDWQQ